MKRNNEKRACCSGRLNKNKEKEIKDMKSRITREQLWEMYGDRYQNEDENEQKLALLGLCKTYCVPITLAELKWWMDEIQCRHRPSVKAPGTTATFETHGYMIDVKRGVIFHEYDYRPERERFAQFRREAGVDKNGNFIPIKAKRGANEQWNRKDG